MPLTSQNCELSGMAATCQSLLLAKPGQKIAIKTGIYFGIGGNPYDCTDGYIKFYSANKEQQKEDKSCGRVESGIQLFNSVSERVTVTYKSDSSDDGASLYAVGKRQLFSSLGLRLGYLSSRRQYYCIVSGPDFQ